MYRLLILPCDMLEQIERLISKWKRLVLYVCGGVLIRVRSRGNLLSLLGSLLWILWWVWVLILYRMRIEIILNHLMSNWTRAKRVWGFLPHYTFGIWISKGFLTKWLKETERKYVDKNQTPYLLCLWSIYKCLISCNHRTIIVHMFNIAFPSIRQLLPMTWVDCFHPLNG